MVKRTYWTCSTLRFNAGMDGRDEVDDIEKAVLIGSKLAGHLLEPEADEVLHAPCLDIDFKSAVDGWTWTLDGLEVLRARSDNRPQTITRGEFVSILDQLEWMEMVAPFSVVGLGTPLIVPFIVPTVLIPSSTKGHRRCS